MPYSRKTELPRGVQNVLPKKAQEIFSESYNNAEKQYREKEKRRGNVSLEEVASKVAWSAVKKKYKKGEDGKWHPK